MSPQSRGAEIRVWPALVIVASAAVFLLWNWWLANPDFRQSQVVRTVITVLVTVLALLLWWTFFSRLGWRVRLAGLALLVAGLLAAQIRLELRGFTGDLVPRLAWREAGAAQPRAEPPPLPPPARREPAEAEPDETQQTAEPSAGPEPAVAAAAPAEPAADLTPGTPDAAPRDAAPAPREFSQFLGPRRDATLAGIHLARDWSTEPPRLKWRQPIGSGWAGFAVAGGLAITQEQRSGREAVVAYDLETGEPRWSHQRGASFASALAGDGPRATPTIHGGRVYALGATGLLAALELATGAVIYEKDVLAETGARRPSHGVAASPLILDDLVVVLAGGPDGRSLVAYDLHTGEQRWSGGDDPAAYSSPLVATLGGLRQIVVLNQHHVTGHDAAGGAVLWQHPWPRGSERVSQPVPLAGDRLFVSTGYGIGGQLLQVSRGEDGAFSVEQLWETRRLKAKFTQIVEHEGFLYGLDDGVLVCLDPADGERRWKRGRYGHGQVLLVDELLLVQAEDGAVVLVDPGPEQLVELGRFQAVEGRAWATPALAGDHLIVRSDVEAACYRLPTAAQEPSRQTAP